MRPAVDLTRALAGVEMDGMSIAVAVVVVALVGVAVGALSARVVDRFCAPAGAGARTRSPGRHAAIAVTTALSFAAITAVTLTSADASPAVIAELGAFLFFAALGVALIVIDIETHRLPDAIVLPAYPVAFGLLAVAAVLSGSGEAMVRAAIGAALMLVGYLLLAMVRPGGMGMGDVKLAGLVGLYLGWIGWSALLVGAVAAFVAGGLFAVALVIARRAGRDTAIPFGPWMLIGAWTGVVAGDLLGRHGGRS